MSVTNVSFDPNSAASSGSGIFGLPFSAEQSRLNIISVPWEATTSYGSGASKGPSAVLKASYQVDLFDADLGDFYLQGAALLKADPKITSMNKKAKQLAKAIIAKGGDIGKNSKLKKCLAEVNRCSETLNALVEKHSDSLLMKNKIVGLLGGDHSTPLGLIKALSRRYPKMGILHIDAHADLRNAYEGFTYSHASIMYNVLNETSVPKIVQVGIRDYCQAEFDLIQSEPARLKTFFDRDLKEALYSGRPWRESAKQIVDSLPQEVYISFDIDGLDPKLCPGTGTPVPGGLEFDQARDLLKSVAHSGRQIIGFDLNEVSPSPGDGEWNANVGARMLFQLCGWTLKSNNH
ncbi:MAG: agmatinase family protein [Oligoflexia bacterium]|nr:agmatinase family protein [Oligoflexia bacterium]